MYFTTFAEILQEGAYRNKKTALHRIWWSAAVSMGSQVMAVFKHFTAKMGADVAEAIEDHFKIRIIVHTQPSAESGTGNGRPGVQSVTVAAGGILVTDTVHRNDEFANHGSIDIFYLWHVDQPFFTGSTDLREPVLPLMVRSQCKQESKNCQRRLSDENSRIQSEPRKRRRFANK